MAIIEYDNNPALTVDEKLQSLMASIQLALNERPGSSSPGGAGMVGDMSKTQLKNLIDTQIKARDQEKYPVGKIEINITGQNPYGYLGFGTWVAWGSGKVPVGVDTTDEDFNEAGLTGGSKDAVIPSHTHSLEGHTHGIGNHTHSMSHTHPISLNTSSESHSHSVSLYRVFDASQTGKGSRVSSEGSSAVSAGYTSTDYHSHSVSGNTDAASQTTTGGASGNTESGGTGDTGSAGVSGVGKNLQPYITCYMFKRTE